MPVDVYVCAVDEFLPGSQCTDLTAIDRIVTTTRSWKLSRYVLAPLRPLTLHDSGCTQHYQDCDRRIGIGNHELKYTPEKSTRMRQIWLANTRVNARYQSRTFTKDRVRCSKDEQVCPANMNTGSSSATTTTSSTGPTTIDSKPLRASSVTGHQQCASSVTNHQQCFGIKWRKHVYAGDSHHQHGNGCARPMFPSPTTLLRDLRPNLRTRSWRSCAA